MAEVVFGMELRGNAVPVEGKENTFKARTTGTGPNGETVIFESEIVLTGDGFDEVGNISYGNRGSLKFVTVGVGHIGPSPVSGLNHGSVIWNVTETEGEFAGATGLITSNFTFSEQGDVVDNHYVRLFIP